MFAHLGFGCGLRSEHYGVFLEGRPAGIDWVEVIAENFLDWSDGRKLASLRVLERVRARLPVVVHGVSLSLGSADGIDRAHLARVKSLLERIDAAWFSDHLCWTGVDGANLHDLFPLPYTEEAIRTVSENILRAQDALGRRILIENVSSYVTFESSEMTEWEFLREVLKRADCGVLLDVNNIYVSSRNHGFDPMAYLAAMPAERVGQIHLAGHTDRGTHLIDTHDGPVRDAVWDLYRRAVERLGISSTMIEWDDRIPEWKTLEAEVFRARVLAETCERHRPSAAPPAPKPRREAEVYL